MSRPLNKREVKKVARKVAEAKNKRMYTLFVIGSISSILLSLYSFTQYYWTIIYYKIPLTIFIVSGLLFGVFIKQYFENVLKQNKVKAQMFWLVVISGSICTSLFFLLNILLAKQEVYSIKATILDSYKTFGKRGRESMNAEVQLMDFTKDLQFPIEEEEKINSSNFVLLDVSKGGLGFEVIRDRTPIK